MSKEKGSNSNGVSGTRMRWLEGLEVDVVVVDTCFPGYVAKADRTWGLTVHSTEDDREIFCINREELVAWGIEMRVRNANRLYHQHFTEAIKQIQKGSLIGNIYCINEDTREMFMRPLNVGEFSSSLSCAFR